MATEFQNALFDTMIQFANHSNEVSKAAETIECKIIACTNEELGEYSANYLGNTITVYSNNHEKYESDEDVYVLVPEGDFSKTKTIIGRVVPKGSVSDGDESSDGKKIYDVTDIPISINKAELISFKNNSNTVSVFNSEIKDSSLSILKKYIEEGKRSFRLYTDAKVEFDRSGQNFNGHYGLKLIIPRVSEEGETSSIELCVFDSTEMIGNANGFYNWSRNQHDDFTIDDKIEIKDDDDIQLQFYCKDYRMDDIDTPDIFFENIRLTLTAELPKENQNGYQLVILPTQTNYFTSRTSDKKTLTPYLRVNGRDVGLNSLKYVYWFIEDRSVISEEDPKFNRYAGLGWQILNPDPVNTWTVSKNDIPAAAFYKCVVVYDELPISATIELKNLLSSSFVIVKPKNVSGIYPKDSKVEIEIITHAEGITDEGKTITYYPSRLSKNGETLDYPSLNGSDTIYTLSLGESEYKCYYRTITIESNLIDDFNTICCTVKDENGKIIGSDRTTIVIGTVDSGSDSPYRVVVTGTPMNHLYDSFGNSPLLKNGVSGTYINKIEPLECKVFENGIELDINEFGFYNNAYFTWLVPANSLFKITAYPQPTTPNADGYYEYYTGTNNKFTYSLEDRFNDTKANKRMFVQVIVGEETIKLPINVFCTQTGRAGSNGTGYTAMLTWDGFPYRSLNAEGLEQKLKFWYNKDKSENNLYYYSYKTKNWELAGDAVYKDILKLYVYNNGAEVMDSSKYTVKYSMFQGSEMFSIKESSPDGRLITLKFDKNKFKDGFNVVQAKITINDKSISNKVIYCYYPLEITIATGADEEKKISVDGGYSEVMYGSDGVDPYYNEEYFVANYDDDDIVDWQSTVNFEIESIENAINTVSIVPAATFDQIVSKNYIQVSAGNLTHVRPIIVYCNRYGRSALDGWDGTKIDINEDGGYILSPQIGAGVKKDGEGFTGVLMGVVNEDGRHEDIGLIGLNKGKETFKLNSEDGSASFGVSGSGQIRFIPGEHAIIEGGMYDRGNGMRIDLTDPSINWANGNFSVDSEGYLRATDLTATNTIQLIGSGYNGSFNLGNYDVDVYDKFKESAKQAPIFTNEVTKKNFYGVNFTSNQRSKSLGFRFNSNVVIEDNLYIVGKKEQDDEDAAVFIHGNLNVSDEAKINILKANKINWQSYDRLQFTEGHEFYDRIVENAGNWEMTGYAWKELSNPDLGKGPIYPTAYFWQDGLKDVPAEGEEDMQFYSASLIPSVRFMISYVGAKLNGEGGTPGGGGSGSNINVVSVKELPETLKKDTIYLIQGEVVME